MSYADDKAAEDLKKLEQKISREYTKSWKWLSSQTDAYFEKYNERWEKEHAAYLDGKYTEQQWHDWQITQMARGERWQKLRDDMAKRIVDTNEIASNFINGRTPYIFSLSHNYSAYEIEQDTGVVFDIYNEEAVSLLLQGENHTEFQVTRPNREKSYNWNRQKIDSALVGAILGGQDIETLTNAFLGVMGSNKAAAIRNARTAYTSAQNAGRMESFYQAEELGIDMMVEWVAALDGRTRDSHRHLDGERVKVGQPFSNGLLYPGDPSGRPEEVYNCRCATKGILPKYDTGRRERSYKKDGYREYDENGKPKFVSNTTYSGRDGSKSYEDWVKVKNATNNNYGKRTKYNPNSKINITMPGYSEKVNEALSKAAKKVIDSTKDSEIEYLSIVDLLTGEELFYEEGDIGCCGFSKKYRDFMKSNIDKKLAFVHSHTVIGGFSEMDMVLLLSTDNMVAMIAAQTDGICYAIEKTKSNYDYPYDDYFKDQLSVYKNNNKITDGEYTKIREKIIVDGMISKYTKGLNLYE